MGGCEVEIIEGRGDFRLEHSSVTADFQLCTKAFMLAFCVVENVDAQFSGHVKAVVRANVDAHLARRTGLPNDTDSPVVVSWDEEPGFHFLKSFVWVLNSLRFP